MGISMGKRLGGPSCQNMNFMMQASREQRKLMYDPQCESALLNSLGPGPAKYNKTKADK